MSREPDFNQLYKIAENQAGYFTSSQAQEAGFSWERLSYYVKTGRIIRIQRSVYRLIQFPNSPYEDLFVAWLRVGSESVISHESALFLYDLSDVLPGEIHVIMPRTGSRRRKGIRLHTNQLMPGDVARREGLPVTNVARTISDVAASGIDPNQLRRAVQEAIKRGLVGKEELLSYASRHGKKVRNSVQNALNGEF